MPIPLRPGPLLLALLLALLPAAVTSPGRDEETLADFRRYFPKYEDTASRVEAVLALEEEESPEVVDALLVALAHEEPAVVRAAVRVLGGFATRPPVERIAALLGQRTSPPVKEGLLRAVETGRYRDLSEVLLPCLEDPAWGVRRGAIGALVATGDGGAAAAIALRCADKEPAVRCAALDGLAALGARPVVALALARLEDEVWQVRASAIHALGTVRDRESIGPLIARLGAEEGRLVADIAAALAAITGQDMGARVELWRKFWDSYGDRFQIPTDEELRRLRERQQERREQYQPPPGAVTYHGVDTPSRSILFVIDVSGSMEQEVVDRERYAGGGYPSLRRIDIVKTELQRTIAALEPFVEFNIFAFATDVDAWKKKLVRANVLNKSSANDWVGKREAIGGASKEDLAAAGLVASANLEAGRTNTYAALMEALGVAPGSDAAKSYAVAVDTIFFLSDGRPSAGEYVDPKDILREVREVNALRKVVIHTLAIGEFQKEFMRQLAAENGGVFVDLGR
ncbi:MAG: HEAT repeat domain-containing protein [Planctomycetota bacterium]